MSLTLRLTLTYLLLTLAGLLLLGFGFTTLAQRATSQQRAQELAGQAEIYTGYVAELVRTPTGLQSLAPSLSASGVLPSGVTVRIFAANGTLLSPMYNLGPFPSRAVLALTIDPLPLPVSQTSDRRYHARPVVVDNETIGIVELSHSIIAERQLQNDLRMLVVQAALLAAAVMMLISLLVARSITRPIRRLTAQAENLATNAAEPGTGFALKQVVPEVSLETQDEIGVLATSLNHMAQQLQARITETEQERARLAAVLASTSEGIVALDAAGTLLFANPAALVLFAADEPAQIISRLAELHLPLQATTYDEYEVQLASRQLLVTLNPVTLAVTSTETTSAQQPALVLVLRDITRLRELEQARTRFFRSISHDLRTPLTAIRGMLENLRDVAPVDQQTALQTLEDEAGRLARLVEELLHPPSNNGALLLTERRPIEMSALVHDLYALQLGRARRAGVILTFTADSALPLVYGDRDRLKQAVLNLLDNALRVALAGGHIDVQVDAVGVNAPETTPLVRVSVVDDGPGVPADLRERIWERGVRGGESATSSASVDYGGTGLGLAIVREIAVAHGGSAWMEPHTPQGARFVIDLPGMYLATPPE